MGVSQGIIQGAAETGATLGAVTRQIVKVAKEVAEQTGLSEESALDKAKQGALQAADTIGPEAVDEVKQSLPDV